MAGKKGKGGGDAGPGEGSKKAQGQARKAEAANKKAAAENAKIAAAEDAEWDQGAKKGNAKKEAAEAKVAEAARKKAERDALLAEEEKNLPSRSGPKNAKTAQKKTRGLDLSSLDEALPALNASGIQNAMDVFEVLDTKSSKKIERRPEKRVVPAFEKWKEATNREKELQQEGFNKSQRDVKLWAEFSKSPANPKNQVHADYNTTKEELREMTAAEKAKIEQRLTAV